jgi:PAS domain S-box-containing protein
VKTELRRDAIFAQNLDEVHRGTDRLFFGLLLVQWIFGILLAVTLSPLTWEGRISSVNIHLAVAIVFGGIVNSLPLILIRTRPGWWGTRQAVAVAQMLWSAMLIHLTGGRIETGFHVFGSLAFLAFYRDWRLLPTAIGMVAADHLARGLFWPDSVYGIDNPEWWRFLEYTAWMVFEGGILYLGCQRQIREMRVVADREAELEQINADIEKVVVTRTRELQENAERYRALVENTNAVPWEYDPAQERLVYVAPQGVRLFGYSIEELGEPGFLFGKLIHPDDVAKTVEVLQSYVEGRISGEGVMIDARLVAADGRIIDAREFLGAPSPSGLIRGITLDMTQQRKLETELRQSQKLESVGRLAAGVAHEINTPVQFVGDSIHFVRTSVNDMSRVIEKLQAVADAAREGRPAAEAIADAAQTAEDADLPYLFENTPRALDRAAEGLGRVAEIVRALREFAHPDRKEMAPADLNRAVESTLTIARNEYKYVADLDTEYGDLPPVRCHAGEVNQVVLNIVVNAAHAIEGVVKGTDRRGHIVVCTYRDGEDAVITISDTGPGIPDSIREQIFDPFFTTKAIGKGTGQGLAIARSVIAEKHGGDLRFETTMGVGTTFIIRLPIDGPENVTSDAPAPEVRAAA